MIAINLLGGGTTNNCKLILYSDNFKAISEYNKEGELEINVTSHKIISKNKLKKVPFLRGIYTHILKNVSKSENGNIKLTLESINVIVLIGYIIERFILKINIMDYIYLLYDCIIFIVIVTNKNMIELHGAEHMIDNYYRKNKNLNDIDTIKSFSIIHKQCSTNDYGIELAILFLLKLFISDFLIRFLLMRSIMYEIDYNKNRSKLIKYVTYPLYGFGMLTQRLFFVRYPKDKDINQAIQTVKELERHERVKI